MKQTHPILYPHIPDHSIRHRIPKGYDALKCKRGEVDMLHAQSLSIFADMANSGKTFAECLTAVLLTGLQWGILGKQGVE